MLSKKYLLIKDYLTRLSNIEWLHRRLIVLAQMYVDIDKGFRFSYHPDENGETDLLDVLARHYKEGFVYFDVGAHIGTYTDMVVKRFDDYEGHLFDVSETTYEKCLERHGHDKQLTINHAALSNTVGEVEYRSYPDDPTRNGISGVRSEGQLKSELLTAPCLTGDHYCKEKKINRIHLLKIDAEGYDLHVLKGFEDMIDKGKIDVIQFEYNIKASETHCMLGDFYDFLEGKGYIIGPVRPDGVKFRKFEFTHNDFESGPNYVAVRPALAHKFIFFHDGQEGDVFLGPEADLEQTVEIIENSPLHLSLDRIKARVSRKKYADEQLEDISQRLNLIGLQTFKKTVGTDYINIVFQRPKHYREVEQIREDLGYWGQDKEAPRYSVCVCNYNMADTLERALTSVLDQLDEKLYEVVVIDDGSTDGSVEVLEKLANRYPNFRYIALPRDPKRRLGETRNISIRAARGEYVLLHIDADDEWQPYLEDLVKLFHKLESAVGYDFMLAGQQTGIAKRNFLLAHGGYENVYRCEDRNLMMKLAEKDRLLFLDYRAYRTRLSRPVKKKIIKAIWDDCSHMTYDLRQNEPKWPFIKFSLFMPFNKRFSPLSRVVRPLLILPIYVVTRFMPPIINPISRQDMHAYHEQKRGTYPEVMKRLGGDPDISFLSPEAQDIFSYAEKLPGFRGSP